MAEPSESRPSWHEAGFALTLLNAAATLLWMLIAMISAVSLCMGGGVFGFMGVLASLLSSPLYGILMGFVWALAWLAAVVQPLLGITSCMAGSRAISEWIAGEYRASRNASTVALLCGLATVVIAFTSVCGWYTFDYIIG